MPELLDQCVDRRRPGSSNENLPGVVSTSFGTIMCRNLAPVADTAALDDRTLLDRCSGRLGGSRTGRDDNGQARLSDALVTCGNIGSRRLYPHAVRTEPLTIPSGARVWMWCLRHGESAIFQLTEPAPSMTNVTAAGTDGHQSGVRIRPAPIWPHTLVCGH
ncbi:hypothetical protein, partial [Promicromonospora panici]|uniref:hypothetical protein n=1 Tax=Promicromonospora panici TaxID=2219658 RepID=UPI001A9186EA